MHDQTKDEALPDSHIDRQSYIAASFLIILAGLVFTVAGGTRFFAPKTCQLPPQGLWLQSGHEATATSRGGAPCLISARNTHANVEALEIVTPPRNGRIDMRGKTGLIYVPNSQFKGEDSFNLKILRRNEPSSNAKIISMKVNVDW
jgi:hypothetical protein